MSSLWWLKSVLILLDRHAVVVRKISPVWGLTVDSSQLTFVPNSKSRDTKTKLNIKNPALLNLDIVP